MPATPSTTGFGYFVISVSVAKWPAASAVSLMPKRAHSIDSTRVRFSTAARAADECAIPGSPLWGDSVTFMILPPRGSSPARPIIALRRDRVGHQPGALHVEADHGAEALGGDVLGRGQVLAAGVVHEHVDAPVALEHAVHERAHRLLLPDVADPRLHTTAVGARHGLLERLGATAAHHHARAAGRQLERATRDRGRVPPPETIATCPSRRPGTNSSEGIARGR